MQGPPNQHWQQQQQPPQHDYGRGQFDLGDGHQLRVKINGKSPENYAKDKISGAIWSLIIGGVILAIVVVGVIGFGIYIYVAAKDDSSPVTKAATAKAASWDGKSTLECKGNDVMAIEGVTATVSDVAIKTSGNCQLTLTNVKITAPVGIEAGGVSKVVVTGGSINGSSNTIVAQNSASVTVSGTQLTGKTKKVGGGKIVGAP